MTDEPIEIPLSGGNVNAAVVRVGDTVRRMVNPYSENVHGLLRHLEQAGFTPSPRFLGLDEKGREVLSFIAGSAEFPADIWTSDALLVQVVTMLRSYHDATVGMDMSPDGWAYAYPDARRREVICHNDFAPYNMVFDAKGVAGIIDFDLAGPGPRLRDLAYLAYWMAPLSFCEGDMGAACLTQKKLGFPRLRLVCETYGTDDFAGLIAMISEVLAHMGDETAALKMIGQEATNRLKEGGHLDHWRREAAAFDAQKAGIIRALSDT